MLLCEYVCLALCLWVLFMFTYMRGGGGGCRGAHIYTVRLTVSIGDCCICDACRDCLTSGRLGPRNDDVIRGAVVFLDDEKKATSQSFDGVV